MPSVKLKFTTRIKTVQKGKHRWVWILCDFFGGEVAKGDWCRTKRDAEIKGKAESDERERIEAELKNKKQPSANLVKLSGRLSLYKTAAMREAEGFLSFNLIGMRIGKWTVLKRVPNQKYMCVCECGAKKKVTSNALKLGTSTGCSRCRKAEVEKEYGKSLKEII